MSQTSLISHLKKQLKSHEIIFFPFATIQATCTIFLNIYLIILHLLLEFLAWFSSYRYGKWFLLYRTRKKRRWALLNFAISRVIIAVLNVSLSDNLRKEIWVLYLGKNIWVFLYNYVWNSTLFYIIKCIKVKNSTFL